MPVRSWEDLLNDAGDAGGTFEVMPEGDYDFVVKEAEAKTASTGKSMWVAKCEIVGGPHNGRLVWHNFVLSTDNPTALGIFFRQMNSIGLNAEYFRQNPADHHVADAMVGRRFRGVLGIKKYQGQDRNEIKQFFPASGAGVGAPPAVTAPPAPPIAPAPPAPAPIASDAHAAVPPAAAPAPPPPPPAPPAPAPIEQPPTPPVAVETPAEQVTPAAPPPAPAPPAPPAPPAATEDAPPPPPPALPTPPAAPEPVAAGVGAGGDVNAPPPPF
jgi:hypothetical protein